MSLVGAEKFAACWRAHGSGLGRMPEAFGKRLGAGKKAVYSLAETVGFARDQAYAFVRLCERAPDGPAKLEAAVKGARALLIQLNFDTNNALLDKRHLSVTIVPKGAPASAVAASAILFGFPDGKRVDEWTGDEYVELTEIDGSTTTRVPLLQLAALSLSHLGDKQRRSVAEFGVVEDDDIQRLATVVGVAHADPVQQNQQLANIRGEMAELRGEVGAVVAVLKTIAASGVPVAAAVPGAATLATTTTTREATTPRALSSALAPSTPTPREPAVIPAPSSKKK
jgi:hypothetical protein